MRSLLANLALAAFLLIAAPAQADTLVENVNGITADADGRLIRFKGLLIGDDGRIVRLLDQPLPPPVPPKCKKKEPCVWPAQPKFRLDGKGRTVLPGFIDSHAHVMGLGWQALTLDLSGAASLADAQMQIRAHARAHPDRKWIAGRGWNQEQWGLGRFPTAAELDAAESERPVWLERVDGHAGWANSAALRLAGITATTRAPAGGQIGMTGGKPNGLLVDAAMDLVTRHIPKPLAKDNDLAFAEAQKRLLSVGVTGVADMGTSLEDWMAFRRAGDEGRLAVRIFSYSAGLDPMLMITGGQPTPWLYGDRLRMAGVKLVLDGALGSRGAWLKAPYADAPGQTGLAMMDDTRLRNVMSRAAMDGFQLAIHAIGDAANTQALDALEEMNATYKGDRRWRIEHAQVIAAGDLPRFARNGVIASMQPVHQTSDRLMAEARLGPARLTGAYAWSTLRTSGARLAFGTDAPVESPAPFAGLAAAISREDARGEPFGGWQPQERLTREAALAAYTTGGAYSAFAEERTGRLAAGLWADFILIDRDPMLATAAELRTTRVLETWVGGRKVFTAGAP